MAISSTTSKNQYTASGSNPTFTYTFKIYSESDIRVLSDDTVKTLSDYSVTGVGNPAGGTVVYNVNPTVGTIVTLKRNEPLTQEIEYVEGDDFPASSHEEGLDRSAIRDQFLQEQIDRAITFPESSTVSGITIPEPEAGLFLAWNATADALENTPGIAGPTGPQGPAGTGDLTGPVASVDNEIALFSGTTGKVIKRATTTGLLKGTSGVISAATAGTDYYNPGGTDVAVADGGTGRSSHTAYAVVCGGTTTTAAQQSIASVGTAGHVLTSNGAGALPTFQAAGSSVPQAVTTATASGSSVVLTVDFTTYEEYEVTFDSISVGAADDSLLFDASSNGGGAYGTTTYSGKRITITTVTNQPNLGLVPNTGTAEGFFKIFQSSTTGNIRYAGILGSFDADCQQTSTGYCTLSAAANRIRFSFGTRSFDAGSVTLTPTKRR